MRRSLTALLLATSLLAAACGADTSTDAGAAEPAASDPDGGDTDDEPGEETAGGDTVAGDPIADALAAEGGEVTLYWPANANFQAFIDEDLVPGFETYVLETFGAEVTVNVLDASGGDGAFLDRLRANDGRDGFDIDVARTAPSDALLEAMADGLLAPLDADPALVPNLADLDPNGTAVFSQDGAIHGAPLYRPTMSLFYNSSQVADPPSTLDELLAFAEANPGTVTYEDPRSATGTGSGTMFTLSVMHSVGDVLDPDSWDDGWDYLRRLQEVVAPQPQAGDQLIDQFARGEVLMVPYWNDAGLFAKEDLGIDEMENTLLAEGFPIRFTPFVVPQGARNPTAAMLLTDYMIGPEMQVRVAERMRQIPSSLASEVTAAIDDDTFGFPLTTIEETGFPAYDSLEALAAISVLNERFETEVLGR
jgi:putative spermidine/putrescine transport system substrate-binding protein